MEGKLSGAATVHNRRIQSMPGLSQPVGWGYAARGFEAPNEDESFRQLVSR